ncbi:MAG TPA: cytochrome P450 [Blastocatellia bacterium]|nr:cytochrome P450 [Blastocatellia bacterium]
MMFPQDPIAAVIHHDPYAYYASLVAHKPLYYDDRLRLWVASSAAAVTAVLTTDLCRVRPPMEPVPEALLGSPAADIFRNLIRMNDGERHYPFKQAVASALASIDAAQVAQQSGKWAQFLMDESVSRDVAGDLSRFAFHLPVYVVGSLLGVPRDMLNQTALWMSDFTRCFAPASSPDQIERGKTAAGHLLRMFRALLAREDGLLGALAREAKRLGREDMDVIIANGIGFLSQAYEATAGLIGATLLALASRPEVRDQVISDPSLLRPVIQEVLRYDSPVQNTRRFLALDGSVAGEEMKAGDVILVILAAANRDPSVNPTPERFDVFRKERRIFTFGVGPHACPGETLATTITKEGVERLIISGAALERLSETMTYRVSANTRIPLFGEG